MGQTTHLAARMEQLAPPGSVRLTPETLRLTEGYVEVRSLGPIPVKGLPDPIEIFELTGAGQARTRLRAAALRGRTRFVGRDAEVEHLRRVLTQADAGCGQVVAVVGEAGVGKSRLTYEFAHSHRVQEWLILEASSVSYGKATSYLPVIDVLKGYFRIGERDDHREMREKVTGKLFTLDEALRPLLSPRLSLLDVPVEDAVWSALDPAQRRQRTLDAVKRLLLCEAQVQPLLVVFEDLHWVDGETQALLDNLVESLGSARLLLVNYRPEYEHRWGSKTAYSQLRLDSLPAESAKELLTALLGPDPGLAPLTQMLVKRGNPFFLEETVGPPGRPRRLRPGAHRAAGVAREPRADRAAHRPVLRAAERSLSAGRVRAPERGRGGGAHAGGGARRPAAARADARIPSEPLCPAWRLPSRNRRGGERPRHRRIGRRPRAARPRELLPRLGALVRWRTAPGGRARARGDRPRQGHTAQRALRAVGTAGDAGPLSSGGGPGRTGSVPRRHRRRG